MKELPLLLHSGKNRREGDAKLTEQLCKTFGVDQIKGDNTDRALKAATVHKSSKPKGKSREEVVVPVFATLLVKKITEDPDGDLSLIGTFIQRPLRFGGVRPRVGQRIEAVFRHARQRGRVQGLL